MLYGATSTPPSLLVMWSQFWFFYSFVLHMPRCCAIYRIQYRKRSWALFFLTSFIRLLFPEAIVLVTLPRIPVYVSSSSRSLRARENLSKSESYFHVIILSLNFIKLRNCKHVLPSACKISKNQNVLCFQLLSGSILCTAWQLHICNSVAYLIYSNLFYCAS